MILYNHDREVITGFSDYAPRSCFIMTQLGKPLPGEVMSIRKALISALYKRNIQGIDANSSIKGKDFLNKIWGQILSVPMGIAIITRELKESTISNIFYELGILNALGKESIVIKSKRYPIPSDLIRTEYIEYDENFTEKIDDFINEVDKLANHYETMGDNLQADPILTIDYYKRAYLITGDLKYFRKIKNIMSKQKLDAHITSSIKHFLSSRKNRGRPRKTMV